MALSSASRWAASVDTACAMQSGWIMTVVWNQPHALSLLRREGRCSEGPTLLTIASLMIEAFMFSSNSG